MTKDVDSKRTDLSRRGALAAAGACFAMLAQKSVAAGAAPAPPAPIPGSKATFARDSDAQGAIEIDGIHQGKGRGKMKVFRFGATSAP